ncbi:WD40/YVTN repeat-like-containing domain-containing protein [Artemisia annua]|uniref:WD40/YVTN repeat-like-containing domain-containing protein n=1 Tax=Artemisia annua TaxID=35608 RepID=A0A2U1KCJ2_ARTAN|nr:WD40/YVTN repeat-like-containing domain-containing protein [Artemisia annua]
MKDASTSFLVDDRKLVKDIKDVCAKANDQVVTRGTASYASVDVESMKVKDKNFARVLPSKVTEVKFYRTTEMRMLVTGNDCGNIGFWKIDSDEDENGIYVYQPHPAFITGISVQSSSLSKIISSCRDGYLRVFDIEKESFDLAYNSDYPIFSIGRPNDDVNCVYLGEDRGGVSILDIRMSKPSKSLSLHYNSVNTIDFNPQDPNLMSTSSSDKTACIWDLRNIDRNVFIKEVKHQNKVNSAYFSPSGSLLATTSMDNNLGLIVSGTSYDVEYMISHSSNTPRFLSTVRGIWGWDDSFIMVANTKKGEGPINIISTDTKTISHTLESEHVNTIPCRLDAHPLMPGVVAGATSGGRVYVWDI